jgi:uncharacterized protein YecA (UPF0149 family)
MNEEIISALINQAFSAINERIDALKKSFEEFKSSTTEKIANFEELHDLFDKELTNLKAVSKVDDKEEENIMEDYKFGRK